MQCTEVRICTCSGRNFSDRVGDCDEAGIVSTELLLLGLTGTFQRHYPGSWLVCVSCGGGFFGVVTPIITPSKIFVLLRDTMTRLSSRHRGHLGDEAISRGV